MIGYCFLFGATWLYVVSEQALSLSRSSGTTYAQLFLYFAKSNSSFTFIDLISLLILSIHMTLILSYPYIFTFILTQSLSFLSNALVIL